MYEETRNNIRGIIIRGDLNNDNRILLDNLLLHLDPFVHLVTHLTNFNNPDPQFRRNIIPATDSQFILCNDDLNSFILNNREIEQNNAIREFYVNARELIRDIVPRT